MTTIDPSAVLAAIKARCEPGAIEQVAWEAYPRFDSDRGKRIAFRAGAEYLRPDVPLLADALQAVLDLASDPLYVRAISQGTTAIAPNIGPFVTVEDLIRIITTALAKGGDQK